MWQHMTASCFRFPQQPFRMRTHVEARPFFIFQILAPRTSVVPVIRSAVKRKTVAVKHA